MDAASFEKDVCLNYVSCVKVDGKPILPPLMSDARRQEMRQYKQLAMSCEANKREAANRRISTLSEAPIHNATASPPLILMETPKAEKKLQAVRTVTFFGDESFMATTPNVTFRPIRSGSHAPFFDDEDKEDVAEDADSDGFKTPPEQGIDSHFHVVKDFNASPGQVSNTSAEVGEISFQDADDELSEMDKALSPVVLSSELGDKENEVVVIEDGKNLTITVHDAENDDALNNNTTDHSSNSLINSNNAERNSNAVGDLVSLVGSPHANDEENDNYSQASFESATSTGTFIIPSSESYPALNSSFLSEGEVVDDDDDLDEAANLQVEIRNTDQTHSAPSTSRCEIRSAFKDDMSTASNFTSTTSVMTSSACDSFGSIGLSKLKSKMQSMSPSIFKIPGDTRSPLLKGVVFMDPLQRPRAIKKIPLEALDPRMKPKFDRVTAAVKGYLVRRLLRTEKMNSLIQTIRDTCELTMNLYEDAPVSLGDSGIRIKPEDSKFHARLIQQLNGACSSFHDVFFKLTTTERMAIIATDRSKMQARAMKPGTSTSLDKKPISVATLRRMERRKTIAQHPLVSKRAKYQPEKLPLHVPSHVVQSTPVLASGSHQTTKSKHSKSYVVSPKRRRLTTSYAKPSTVSVGLRNPTSARLSAVDRIKATSTSSLSRLSRSSAVQKPIAKTDSWHRKKMDATFVKAKPCARPLVSSNR